MAVRDFGRLDGPVVLFGGPYSNLPALRALADVLKGRPAICTGDIIGYCAEPVETVALLRSTKIHAIAGNCERQIAEGAEDCGCGFENKSACDLLSRGWYPFARAACDADTVNWLDALPEIGVFTHEGRRYGVIHGGVTSISRFLWPSSADNHFLSEIRALEDLIGPVDGVIAGHSGVAFHRGIDGLQWINAGVIGLPPHDGRQATRYAVLEGGEVIIHRLDYDAARARERMEAAGLVQGYHRALESGLWTSEDVLPPELRR